LISKYGLVVEKTKKTINVEEVINLYKQGYKQTEISKILNYAKSSVSSAIKRSLKGE
jgi:transcriptional regulator